MKLNTSVSYVPVFTHEGTKATRTSAEESLRRRVLTCLLWEDNFYERGADVATAICELAAKVDHATVAALAVEARERYGLRHVPLLLVCCLAGNGAPGGLIADTVESVVRRADELTELLAVYWRNGDAPIDAGIKRGLARAFKRFNAYQLAKYNRDSKVRLRDVLRLVHPKPIDRAQSELWKAVIDGTLAPPDTWEVALSAGADKRLTFERLLREQKLGGLATLRNLRNMIGAGVEIGLIRERLASGCGRAWPYQFVSAAKHAPQLEPEIERAMFASMAELPALDGDTGVLVDVSGSMNAELTPRNNKQGRARHATSDTVTTRVDVAAGLAILVREKATNARVATFSTRTVALPARRGFALRDAIANSQLHASTMLRAAMETLQQPWASIDRLIVITDEQSGDGIGTPWAKHNYLINVAPYSYGVGYRNGWQHIDGWSDRVVDYIVELERLEALKEQAPTHTNDD